MVELKYMKLIYIVICNIGIVGATGAVGKEIVGCLEGRGKLDVGQLRIFGKC